MKKFALAALAVLAFVVVFSAGHFSYPFIHATFIDPPSSREWMKNVKHDTSRIHANESLTFRSMIRSIWKNAQDKNVLEATSSASLNNEELNFAKKWQFILNPNLDAWKNASFSSDKDDTNTFVDDANFNDDRSTGHYLLAVAVETGNPSHWITIDNEGYTRETFDNTSKERWDYINKAAPWTLNFIPWKEVFDFVQ